MVKINLPAVINLVYADSFGLNKEFMAILVMVVTVFALFTLPMLPYLGSVSPTITLLPVDNTL